MLSAADPTIVRAMLERPLVSRLVPTGLAVASLLAVAAAAPGCVHSLRRFPLQQPMVQDPDQQPFEPAPDEYFSPFAWDGLDQMVFRPLANFFAVDPAGPAVNVNAVDEIPNSSWFTNRLGTRTLTPEEVAAGPCTGQALLDPEVGPWTVTGAKPNGANPGFLIKGPDGSRYLLKFDGLEQQPRATAADAIGTRIYWAAGYYTPCNRILYFDRSILVIQDGATADGPDGEEEPLTQEHLDEVFSKALRLEDGRYRTNASLFLHGMPIGPWRYEKTRDGDPNDVIPHEERREIRGAGVLASWVNHFDSREQNTLDMFVRVDGERGFVRHHYIDFGDCFGSMWEWDMLSRRFGHSYFVDFEHIAADFISLGAVVRPWDKAEFGPAGEIFGYFTNAPFDPGDWHNEYPNPAFSRMQDHDGAWMARILAGFTGELIDAAVDAGRFPDPFHATELKRILRGRRMQILTYWFAELSPLARPTLHSDERATTLCLDDLAVQSEVVAADRRTYTAEAWLGLEFSRRNALRVTEPLPGRVCVQLPAARHATEASPTYVVLDVVAATDGEPQYPARVHVYQTAPNGFVVVGLERPDGHGPPEE